MPALEIQIKIQIRPEQEKENDWIRDRKGPGRKKKVIQAAEERNSMGGTSSRGKGLSRIVWDI